MLCWERRTLGKEEGRGREIQRAYRQLAFCHSEQKEVGVSAKEQQKNAALQILAILGWVIRTE